MRTTVIARTLTGIAVCAVLSFSFASASNAQTTDTARSAARSVRADAGTATLTVGATGEAVFDAQRRLNQAGINTAVTGTYSQQTAESVSHLQWKFFLPETGAINARTWKTLRQITRNGDGVPGKCRKGRSVLCVDMNQRVLRYFVGGKLTRTFDARFGAPRTPTRKGSFRVRSKIPHGHSPFSGTYMPYALYFDRGIAVHYSPSFARDGYGGASLGCVNLRDLAGAKTLYRQVKVGDRVVVY